MDEAGLLERERELGALDDLVEATSEGEGRLLLIEGPAGIGKSRLLAGLRRAAEPRLEVLTARAGELEREFPFAVVRQLFEARAVRDDSLFEGAAAAARGVFGAVDQAADEAEGSFALLHGLYWLCLNVAAERPLLLAVDDLQWCDAPSLRFLAYLARRLDGAPVSLAATLRSGEPGAEPGLLAELTGDPAAAHLHPGPLSVESVRALVRERLGQDADAAFCDACHDTTGGNPLLLGQLLVALAADDVSPAAASAEIVRDVGPRAVSSGVLTRLARLGADAIEVARGVAVLGDAASGPIVSAVTELAEARVAEAMGRLGRGDILRPDPPPGFVHPLVREAVYRELSQGERELYHSRAAQALRDVGGEPDVVASQLLRTAARGEDWVADLLHQAGRAAMHRGAAESAAAYLSRALAEPPREERRPELLFELGTAELAVDGRAAATHLREAYRALDDPLARGVAAGLLARALMFTGAVDDAMRVARTAAAEVPPELADLRRALDAFDLVAVYFGGADPRELEWVHEHRDGIDETGPGARMVEAAVALDWAYRAGPADECARLALRAVSDGALMAADPGLTLIAPIIVLALADRDEALETSQAQLEHARRRGSLFDMAGAHLWHGFVLTRRGDLSEAEAVLRIAIDEVRQWGFAEHADVYTSAFLADVLLERGDVAGARAVHDRAADPGNETHGARYLLNGEMELLVAEGRAEEAIELADEFAERFAYYELPAYSRWRSCKAQALDRLGRTDEAVDLVRDELALAERWGAPGPLGTTLRILGRLRRDDGIDDLRAAIDVLDGSPARLELAKALAAYGAALRRAGRPRDAREPLRRALELAAACSADGLAEHARAELHATGARPRRDAMSGPESLTPSERRVVDLAAEGASNRDIAQTLFVAPKTVEIHLTHAYRKLGIRSRRELAGALAGS